MVSTGFKQSCFFGRESAYGSAATVNRSFGLVQSVSPTEKNNTIRVRTLNGKRDYFTVIPGKFEVSGGIEYYLQDCRFLKYAFGEDSGSTAATINSGPRYVYSSPTDMTGTTFWHILGSADSPSPDEFPSFTLEFTDDEDTATNKFNRSYTGCMVDSLSVSGDVDTPVSVSVDWIGQGVTASVAAETSVTEPTKDPYVFYQGGLYLTAGNVVGTSALSTSARLCELNNFNLTINNNLEPTWYVSGTCNTQQSLRGLKNLIPKGRDYEASIGLNFKNWDQYRRFLGSASARGLVKPQGDLDKYQVVLDFVRAGEGFGFGATTADTCDMFRVVLASCLFEDVDISGAPEDIVAENYTIFPKAIKVHAFDDISGSYA